MFSERMAKGKTRMIVDLSDSNLLRLRVLQTFENEECSFSDYLDRFLDRMIDRYIDRFFENGYDPFDPRALLINELLNSKMILCGHHDISIELESEEADPLREKFENMEYRDPLGERKYRPKRCNPFFLNLRKGMAKPDAVDDTGRLAVQMLVDSADQAMDEVMREKVTERTEETLSETGKKKAKKSSKNTSQA